MSVWYTRPDRERNPSAGAANRGGISPSLLFHKWHAYDVRREQGDMRRGGDRRREDPRHRQRSRGERPADESHPSFETTASRNEYLGAVASAVADAAKPPERPCSSRYPWWLEQRYIPAVKAQSAEISEAKLLSRLVAGFATNPALEAGIALHPLYGVPLILGSGVKGLAHHVAEQELLRGREGWFDENGQPHPPPPEPEQVAFLQCATKVRSLFGSLTVRQPARRPGEPPAPPTPRTFVERWLAGLPPQDRLRPVLLALLTHTGGRLSFWDAVPAAGQTHLLEPDVLNPHYPDFYRREGAVPPSDDQNPTPIFFLAVPSGTRFLFPWRLGPAPEPPHVAELLRAYLVPEEDSKLVRAAQGWLRSGLESWGAGARTAAGYGYFTSFGTGPST